MTPCSSEGEEEDDIFVTPAPAEKPRKSTKREQGGVRFLAPFLHMDLLDMCKCVAEKPGSLVPWPVVIVEPTKLFCSSSWRVVQWNSFSLSILTAHIATGALLQVQHPSTARRWMPTVPPRCLWWPAMCSHLRGIWHCQQSPSWSWEGLQGSHNLGQGSQHCLHPHCRTGRAVWAICWNGIPLHPVHLSPCHRLGANEMSLANLTDRELDGILGMPIVPGSSSVLLWPQCTREVKQ